MLDDLRRPADIGDIIAVVASCLDPFSDRDLVSIRAVVMDTREKAPHLTQTDDELAEIASIQAIARGLDVIAFR
jgi:hypothetical protein